MTDRKPINLEPTPLDLDKHWKTWTDMLGVEYQAGDFVAYAATVGRSAGLTVAMVRKINRYDSQGNLIHLRKWNRESNGYDQTPWATVTMVPLVDSVNRYGRWSGRDVTIGPEKIIKLNVTLTEIIGDRELAFDE